jgi:hypothetical protein
MKYYIIEVERGPGPEGRLVFRDTTSVHTTCWWNPDKRIPANPTGYLGCSATTMRTKLNSRREPREAIYIPHVSGFSGIFIHMGTGPSWSDGCLVIVESKMLEIWNAVNPKNAANVIVTVRDKGE